MIKKKCLICNKEFMTYPSQNIQTCSKDCNNKNISNKLKGKLPQNWHPTIGFKKGKLNPMYHQHPQHFKGWIIQAGYKLIYMPEHPYSSLNGYVRKSQLVMEEYLGRYLKPEEIVHHINFDKLDNRIENLHLFNNRAEHLKYHLFLRRIVRQALSLGKLIKYNCKLCGKEFLAHICHKRIYCSKSCMYKGRTWSY